MEKVREVGDYVLTQIIDMDLMISYALQIINSLSLPFAFIIGTSFSFFLIKGILDIFKKFQGHE